MCIRDRKLEVYKKRLAYELEIIKDKGFANYFLIFEDITSCLLYTSDAADERSSVDLGGRRIIKKKK